MIAWGLDGQPMRLERLRGGDWGGIACMAVGLGSLEYVLEEGQRKDWFGDNTIFTCAVVSAVALAGFLAIELTRREPFIDLRLLRKRSLAVACAVNFVSGLALYGSIYILPLYLQRVQGYDAFQIGMVQMWMGLPQLAILPFLPLIMRYVDSRLVLGFGLALFAASCLMNGYTHDGGHRDRSAQMVAAGARAGAAVHHLAAVADGDGGHHAGAGGGGERAVQHDAQSRRQFRHRDAGDGGRTSRALAFLGHRRADHAELAAAGGAAAADGPGGRLGPGGGAAGGAGAARRRR